jgi:tetratricopeptide (TPR) repeat protein
LSADLSIIARIVVMAKKKRRSTDKPNVGQAPIELPDRRAMERMMREMVGEIGGARDAHTPLERAQEVMYQAFEARGSEQVRLAQKALQISPDCADAYVMLAEHAPTLEEARSLYEQGLAAGERNLGPQAMKEDEGHFWGLLETRPYMRALEGLAQCLWEAGHREGAAERFQEMLRLNPNDNQGARYPLATLLLDLDREEDLQDLLEQYADDGSPEWAYMRALLAFRADGESARANKLLKQATKANKYVPAYLLGSKQLPRQLPPYVTMGGEDEAISYAAGNRRGWLNTPGAISWLRKTLNVPLPKSPKPRRPSWPQLKLSLLRLPQEIGEVWQVDCLPDPGAGREPSAKQPRWLAVIVGRASRRLLDMEFFDSQPKPTALWHFITDAMRKPRHEEPYRPAKIEVRQPSYQTAWKTKLRQIGVECDSSDHLDAVDQIREQLPLTAAEEATSENAADTDTGNAAELLTLPQEPDEVWQTDVRLMPAWITGEGHPYRPWAALVIDHTNDLVLAHEITGQQPSDDQFWRAVLQAIRHPVAGSPHRPGRVEVRSAELCDTLRPHLEQAHIECVVAEELEHIDFVFNDMAEHLAGPEEPPCLLNVPGLEPAQMGSFYAAAAEFYRRKPWQQVPGDTIIKVACEKFHSGPWYAVVMGQSGVQQGLAIYEDLAALQDMITGDASEEDNARGMSGLSLMFGEAFEIAVRDLDAAERHGWAVAGPEAYPLVLHINPGCSVRPPLRWELELLEGCLRTIPDFLTAHSPALTTIVPAASGELTLQLSWIE